MQSWDFDLIAVAEMWWDSSHDWNVVRKGYGLFRRDRPEGVVVELPLM